MLRDSFSFVIQTLVLVTSRRGATDWIQWITSESKAWKTNVWQRVHQTVADNQTNASHSDFETAIAKIANSTWMTSKLEAPDAKKEFDEVATEVVCEVTSNFKCLRIADHEVPKFSFLKITPAVESNNIKLVVEAFEDEWAKKNLFAKPVGFAVYMFAQPQNKYDLFINIDPGDYERLFKKHVPAYEEPHRKHHGEKIARLK